MASQPLLICLLKPLTNAEALHTNRTTPAHNTIAIHYNQYIKLTFVQVHSRHTDIIRSYPKLHMVTWNRRLLEF